MILVTGGTGTVGSQLAAALRARGVGRPGDFLPQLTGRDLVTFGREDEDAGSPGQGPRRPAGERRVVRRHRRCKRAT